MRGGYHNQIELAYSGGVKLFKPAVPLAALFELNDRYQSMRHKTETLMDITTVFAGLAHAKRGAWLEWAVIVLIAIEIVLSVAAMLLK